MRREIDSTTVERVSLPDCLTSSTAKLVYLYVLTVGVTTVPLIKERLNLPALTVYQIVDQLTEYGLLEREGKTIAAESSATENEAVTTTDSPR